MKRFATLTICLALPAAACGGRQSADDDSSAVCQANLPPDLHESFVRHPVDTNGDCEPDFWKLYDVVDEDGEVIEDVTRFTDPDTFAFYRENRRIRQKWLDVNFDGSVDVIRYYDIRGDLESQQVDVDFDGGLDRTDSFDEGIVNIRETDENGDGEVDVTRYYRNGVLHRMEMDTDFDGQPDTWRFYEDGHLLRIGQDTNGDEDIDAWLRRPTTSTAPPSPSTDAGTSDSDGETPDEDEDATE